ncbi:MAG: hypothetical protein H7X89_15615 [Rhizobiales bacterium]|nr:hypothetical protein [Hyphomicrobiales bacterium]
MRDYALNRAMAAESLGMSPLTLFRNWKARREMAKLANCDGEVLRSLAVTRDDVRWAMGLPLSRDPRLALEDRVFRRSRA